MARRRLPILLQVPRQGSRAWNYVHLSLSLSFSIYTYICTILILRRHVLWTFTITMSRKIIVVSCNSYADAIPRRLNRKAENPVVDLGRSDSAGWPVSGYIRMTWKTVRDIRDSLGCERRSQQEPCGKWEEMLWIVVTCVRSEIFLVTWLLWKMGLRQCSWIQYLCKKHTYLRCWACHLSSVVFKKFNLVSFHERQKWLQ